MIDNPVSREIVNSVYNRFGDYFPQLVVFKRELDLSFSVEARLPKSYKELIPYINGNHRFIDKIKERIGSVLLTHVFRWQSYLEIEFSESGISFGTDGNACRLYVSGDICSYHNIDTYEQASILFIALSIYLSQLYPVLEYMKSRKPEELKDIKKIENFISFRIKLNKTGCKEEYGKCTNWASWICEHCIRNWARLPYHGKEELELLGDKFESPDGPINCLCISCGANLRGYICQYCGKDNKDYFPELEAKIKADRKNRKISDFF
jgi:hypothetical protein